jgi:hypothetical protein
VGATSGSRSIPRRATMRGRQRTPTPSCTPGSSRIPGRREPEADQRAPAEGAAPAEDDGWRRRADAGWQEQHGEMWAGMACSRPCLQAAPEKFEAERGAPTTQNDRATCLLRRSFRLGLRRFCLRTSLRETQASREGESRAQEANVAEVSYGKPVMGEPEYPRKNIRPTRR